MRKVQPTSRPTTPAPSANPSGPSSSTTSGPSSSTTSGSSTPAPSILQRTLERQEEDPIRATSTPVRPRPNILRRSCREEHLRQQQRRTRYIESDEDEEYNDVFAFPPRPQRPPLRDVSNHNSQNQAVLRC